ncbi:Bug family tripartite tricarboxylate transporter substrate binding protein [Bordetella genomosp. 13]|uniref:Bug family tripartite tricarboxylate transporter substrate binding protein n=1 Tax=Bordetella genomosp. 13 TaxID=463040 RepID=UPI0011A4CBDC|nr:tripartite tricarboxylate transporter substrate binding protein [Bordetella genomosp. 13]
MRKSTALRCLFALGLAMAGTAAHAEWPDRPVRIIVPSAAGGSPDIMSRLLGKALGERLGQAVVIENRPGAGGNIGMQTVMNAAPDGYTIGYGNNATLATNEFLFSTLPYDPQKLVPVIKLASTASLVVVNESSPVKSVQELIAFAKKKPDGVVFGSGGTGTTSHLGAELFKTMTGIQGMHVPYKGAPQAINDLLGGRFDFMFDNIASVGPNVGGGRLRAIAVTSSTRSPLFPDVPTLDEAGVKGFQMEAWGAVVAPPGTPDAVVTRLNAELNAVLKDEQVRKQLAQLAFVPLGGTAADLRALMASERDKWGKVVRESGAKVD